MFFSNIFWPKDNFCRTAPPFALILKNLRNKLETIQNSFYCYTLSEIKFVFNLCCCMFSASSLSGFETQPD